MLKYVLALLVVVELVLPFKWLTAYEIEDCRPYTNKYLLVSSQALEKNVTPLCMPIKEFFQNISLDLKLGGFYPLAKKTRNTDSTKTRRIYPIIWVNAGLVVTKTFCNRFQTWFGIDYIFTNGESTILKKKSHFNLLPLSLGVSYLQPISCNTIAYLGVGGTYSFLWIRNHSKHFLTRVNHSGFGGIAKAGFYYWLWDKAYVDAFVNYFYQYFTFRKHKATDGGYIQRNDVNLSGLSFGLGLKIMF